MSVSIEAMQEIKSWLMSAHEGDRLVISGGDGVIYNSFGCKISRFEL